MNMLLTGISITLGVMIFVYLFCEIYVWCGISIDKRRNNKKEVEMKSI